MNITRTRKLKTLIIISTFYQKPQKKMRNVCSIPQRPWPKTKCYNCSNCVTMGKHNWFHNASCFTSYSFLTKKRQILRQIITGWIRRRLIHSSFNTKLISINYLLYRNNHLSMPWKTINQRREWKKNCAPSYVSKDDSFINEHFIPKKANDDSRVVVSGLKFQKRTKIGLH